MRHPDIGEEWTWCRQTALHLRLAPALSIIPLYWDVSTAIIPNKAEEEQKGGKKDRLKKERGGEKMDGEKQLRERDEKNWSEERWLAKYSREEL